MDFKYKNLDFGTTSFIYTEGTNKDKTFWVICFRIYKGFGNIIEHDTHYYTVDDKNNIVDYVRSICNENALKILKKEYSSEKEVNKALSLLTSVLNNKLNDISKK